MFVLVFVLTDGMPFRGAGNAHNYRRSTAGYTGGITDYIKGIHGLSSKQDNKTDDNRETGAPSMNAVEYNVEADL